MNKLYFKIYLRRFLSNKTHYVMKFLILAMGIIATSIIYLKINELNIYLNKYNSPKSNIYRVVDANPDNELIKGVAKVLKNEVNFNYFENYSFYNIDSTTLFKENKRILYANEDFIRINNIIIDDYFKENKRSPIIYKKRSYISIDRNFEESIKFNGQDIIGDFKLNSFSTIKNFDILIIDNNIKSELILYSIKKSKVDRNVLNYFYNSTEIILANNIIAHIEEIVNNVKVKEEVVNFASLPYTPQFNDVVRTPALLAEKLLKHRNITSSMRIAFQNGALDNLGLKIIYADYEIFEYFKIPKNEVNKSKLNNFAYLRESLKDSIKTKEIEINGVAYFIAGYFKDIPNYYLFEGDIILGIEPYLKSQLLNNWFDYSVYTYVKIHENASFRKINQDIFYWLQLEKTQSHSKLQFQPIYEPNIITTNPSNKRKDIYILIALYTFLILSIISTASGYSILQITEFPQKSAELGVRKLSGSSIFEILLSVFLESVLLGVLAFLIAMILFNLSVYFDILKFNIIFNWSIIWNIFLLTIMICIFSIFLPLLFLIKLKISTILSNKISQLNKSLIFRDLVIGLQLSLSMIIIIFALVSIEQVNHIKEQKISYSSQHYVQFDKYNEIVISKVKQLEDIEFKVTDNILLLIINNSKIWETMNNLQNIWQMQKLSFEPEFYETSMNDIYNYEVNFEKILHYFVILILSISIISVYSITKFLSDERRNEFGIKKIYGASIWNIFTTQFQEYYRLLIVSIIFTFMITFFPLNSWLEKFETRISIPFFPYLISFLSVFLILTSIIFANSLKMILTKPIRMIYEHD